MVTIRFRLLLLVAALSLGLPAGAQLHRGARTVVRGGLLEKPDSLKGRRDSLRLAGLVRQIDSIAAAEYAADSAAPTTCITSTRWPWRASTPHSGAWTPRPNARSTKKAGL